MVLAMTFCISFYGIFLSVDAHFACMDGVRLGFLSLLQFLEHWLVHNSGVSLFFSYQHHPICLDTGCAQIFLVILHVLLRLLLYLGICIL